MEIERSEAPPLEQDKQALVNLYHMIYKPYLKRETY